MERESALRTFKRGEVLFLVATDVASRGLDIPKCMHVINYDLPTCILYFIACLRTLTAFRHR